MTTARSGLVLSDRRRRMTRRKRRRARAANAECRNQNDEMPIAASGGCRFGHLSIRHSLLILISTFDISRPPLVVSFATTALSGKTASNWRERRCRGSVLVESKSRKSPPLRKLLHPDSLRRDAHSPWLAQLTASSSSRASIHTGLPVSPVRLGKVSKEHTPQISKLPIGWVVPPDARHPGCGGNTHRGEPA